MFRVCRRRLHFASLAYAATTFAATLIDSIFKFYYVKVFLIKYQVSDYWFNVAQVNYEFPWQYYLFSLVFLQKRKIYL